MKKQRLLIFVMIIFSVMGILTFSGLGNSALSQKEAYNALMGKYVEYPAAWNQNSYINKISNWPVLCIINFARFFSQSEFSLRLWFAFIGILSAAVFFLLALELASNEYKALLALFIYGTSVPVLLMIRIVDNFSPSLLLINLTLLFYLKWTNRNNKGMLLLFIIVASLLFYSNSLSFIITITNIIFSYIAFDLRVEYNKSFLWANSLICSFTLPFFIFTKISSSTINNYVFPHLGDVWKRLIRYIWDIQLYFIPFITFILLYFIFTYVNNLGKHIKKSKAQLGFDGIPLSILDKNPVKNNLIVISPKYRDVSCNKEKRNIGLIIGQLTFSLLAVFLVDSNSSTDFILPGIPMLYVITAIVVSSFYKREKILCFIICMVLVFTNLLNVLPNFIYRYAPLPQHFNEEVFKALYGAKIQDGIYLEKYQDNMLYNVRSYLVEYVYSISNIDKFNSNRSLVAFLQSYTKPGDSIGVIGDCSDIIRYYTKLNVIDYNDPRRLASQLRYPVNWVISIDQNDSIFSESSMNFPIQYLSASGISTKMNTLGGRVFAYPNIQFDEYGTNYVYPYVNLYRNRQ